MSTAQGYNTMQLLLLLKITTINPGLFPQDRIYQFTCKVQEPGQVVDFKHICNPKHTYYENHASYIRKYIYLESINADEIDPNEYIKALLNYLNAHHKKALFEDTDIPEIEKKIKESLLTPLVGTSIRP